MNEIITKKLTELSAQKEQLLAQRGAVIGAEQVLKELLTRKEAENHERSDAVGDRAETVGV
ncbi:MAG: hypothetical protein IJT41_03450 [Clostridia bacterium]|nr:hypothetical protein [Clostridia bacterium]